MLTSILTVFMNVLKKIYNAVSTIGYSNKLPSYEKKRVLVFNQLNFAAFVFALARVLYIFYLTPSYFSYQIAIYNLVLVAVIVLLMWFMYLQKYAAATIFSFAVVPPLLAFIGWASKDEGMDMFIINYMMFCFFFLRRLRNSLIAFVYCFAIFFVMHFKLETDVALSKNVTPTIVLTVFNYVVAFIMFLATLALIKYQVWNYEKSIKEKTKDLEERSIEIEAKNDTLKMQSENLEIKTKELTSLNNVKTKLLSVISHDLRTSIYAFKNILDTYNMGHISKEELLNELPDLSNEIDSCTEVMDNLLNWGKGQFAERGAMPELLNVYEIVNEAFKLLSGRCEKKKLFFSNNVPNDVCIFADRQMMQIVIRNLISNAVKFTPEHGSITVTATTNGITSKILVTDTGVGMSKDDIDKFIQNKLFTNEGTNQEMGTGLGLIICKDFVYANNGLLQAQAKQNEGCAFTITLPAIKD